jgi:hypothetical protein
MRHAVVIRVKFDPTSERAHRHAVLNDVVIPEVRELPGFQKAKWMIDGAGTGLQIALFDTHEHAKAAVTTLTPQGGPEVISSEVYEVEVEVAV